MRLGLGLITAWLLLSSAACAFAAIHFYFLDCTLRVVLAFGALAYLVLGLTASIVGPSMWLLARRSRATSLLFLLGAALSAPLTSFVAVVRLGFTPVGKLISANDEANLVGSVANQVLSREQARQLFEQLRIMHRKSDLQRAVAYGKLECSLTSPVSLGSAYAFFNTGNLIDSLGEDPSSYYRASIESEPTTMFKHVRFAALAEYYDRVGSYDLADSYYSSAESSGRSECAYEWDEGDQCLAIARGRITALLRSSSQSEKVGLERSLANPISPSGSVLKVPPEVARSILNRFKRLRAVSQLNGITLISSRHCRTCL